MPKYAIPRDVVDIVLAFCEGLASPVSLSVAILVRYGEWDQLASMQVDPLQYNCSERYFADVSAVSFLRKCKDLPTTIDRKAKALENFYAGERDCFRTNLRLSHYLDSQLNAGASDVVERVIVSARKKIASILGPFPDLAEGRFGPGATYGDRGQLTTVPDKMSSRPTLTSAALPFLFPWSGTAWASACASAENRPEFVKGNRFTTVPKDCTKDRGIAVEPSINLFYQLGMGQLIRRRLRRAGLDLRIGQDIHKQVACEASIRGHLATIDLSNASDTVCSNLVRLLLPHRWYECLSALRSPCTYVEGRWVRLEKFSSMGNGYTFELETLIFLCLSIAAIQVDDGGDPIVGHDVFAFGDDIIVPDESCKNVIAVLQYFGMTTNERKTFISGPFRESCGGDYFRGVNVRPYFLKEFPSEPQHFIAMANGIRRLAHSEHCPPYRDYLIRRAWFRIMDAIPSDIRRLRGPQDLGDLVIHDAKDRWSLRVRNCIRYIQVYRPARFRVIGWAHFKPDVVLATALYGVGDGLRGITPRNAVIGFKKGWVPFS